MRDENQNMNERKMFTLFGVTIHLEMRSVSVSFGG